MSNDRKFYCRDLDRWFDSMYELNEAVFGDMQWPSAEEERDMIRAANISAGKKGKPRESPSEETRIKISAASKGRPGKPHSEESRIKIGAIKKGKKWSPEAIAKRQETRRLRREARLAQGIPDPNKGKKKSPESEAKRQETRRRNREAKLAAQALTQTE